MVVIVSNIIRNRFKLLQVVFNGRISSEWGKAVLPSIVVVLSVKVVDESGLNANNADNKKGKNGCGLHFQSERVAEEVDS